MASTAEWERCFQPTTDESFQLAALAFSILPIAEEPLHIQPHSAQIFMVRLEQEGLIEALQSCPVLLEGQERIAPVVCGLPRNPA